jgi:hypothetical protein
VVFESASCAVVLRTGSLELEEGTWVEVRFSPVSPRRDDDPAYYVRVSSDLSPRPARRRRYRRIRRWPAEDTWPTLSPRGTGETGVDWASVLNPAALVVGIGLLALVALGFAAMFSADEGDMSTIATAAFGVIGSVVGAFFGVHAGIGAGDRMQETLTGMVDDKEAKIDAMQQELDEARRTAD